MNNAIKFLLISFLISISLSSLYAEDKEPLKILYFYSPTCKACIELKKDFIPDIKLKYHNDIIIEEYNIAIAENYEFMISLEMKLKDRGGYSPEIIVADRILKGEGAIRKNLDSIIQKSLKMSVNVTNKITGNPNIVPLSTSIVLQKFKSISVYTVIFMGLMDGVNPCAFTTIVFFMSFLAFAGYKKREILFSGISFVISVFLAYLLIGLGIFTFLRALTVFNYIAYFINILASSLAIFLGIFNLLDYINLKKGKGTKDLILKLPFTIKNKIHSLIGTSLRKNKYSIKRLVWISFSIGFTISLLEFFCTGQVYIPTLAVILRLPQEKLLVFTHIFLYNLAFIMPLVAVLILAFLGESSSEFSRFTKKHLALVKLCTAILFFVLGMALIYLG